MNNVRMSYTALALTLLIVLAAALGIAGCASSDTSTTTSSDATTTSQDGGATTTSQGGGDDGSAAIEAGLYPAPVSAKKYGYIDKTGKIITEPVYESVSAFSGGLGFVDRLVDGAHRWAYLDAGGRVVWENK